MKKNKKTTLKKRLLCLALSICMCASLSLFAQAIEPLDGPINADDNAQLVTPTLEISSVPQNAYAVGRNMINHTTHYYNYSADVTTLNPNASVFRQDGFIPEGVLDQTEALLPNAIIGEDERELQEFTDQYPNRTICLIIAFYSDPQGGTKIGYGTATLIGPDVAVTAAHCIYDYDLGWPIDLTIYAGATTNAYTGGMDMPLGVNAIGQAAEVVISAAYKDYRDNNIENDTVNFDHDWALIRTVESVGDYCGYLGFEYQTGSLITGEYDPLPLVCGYPYDKNDLDKDEIFELYDQYMAFGEVFLDYNDSTTCSNGTVYGFRKLKHRADANNGQSGSALIKMDLFASNPYTIIGIHVGGEGMEGIPQSQKNVAVGINSQLYSFMLAYKNAS